MQTISIHISKIRPGDVVLHDGNAQTVGFDNIKYDSCVGITLFGDSYRLGYKPVQLCVITKYYQGKAS